MAAKNKNKIDVVYSTNPNFQFQSDEEEEQITLPAKDQNLRVSIDRKQRKGKEVTLITGFIGSEDDLNLLGKELKQKCGVGGSVKDGEIIIQGNHAKKILELLLKQGYKAKQIGGN
ncbi:MAG: translation initiation factor [Crocinitomix sp.]|nr:translation initiation factor [Crocinitomix sp.]